MLHIVQNLNYGGMERLIGHMVRLMDHDHFEPHILALQYLGRFSEDLEQIATLHTASPMSRWSLIRPHALATTIAGIAPDVVHTHSGVWLKATRAARMAGVPVAIHTEHGRRAPDPWSDRMIDSIAARHSDHVVAVSDALARHLNVLVGVPERKVSVIVNGVETNAFLPDRMQLRRELGIAPHMHVIGSVGRLEPVKGYDVALRALAQLDRTDVVLVIAGDGSERERLQMLASSLGVARRVFFLGWRNDVELLHAASDIFSMSSHSEGTSVSLLEAMAAGKCPVVTTVGGNAAVLGSKLRHRLVKPNDAVALALAWRAALDDGARTTRDGAAARVRVAAQFSVERMVRSYEELYVSPNWQRRREAMQHAGRP